MCPDERIAQLELQTTDIVLGIVRRAALGHFHDPGNKQEVSRPGLYRADAGEERIGDRVADGADTEFVKRPRLVHGGHKLEYGPAFLFAAVQPAEGGVGDSVHCEFVPGLVSFTSGLPNCTSTSLR